MIFGRNQTTPEFEVDGYEIGEYVEFFNPQKGFWELAKIRNDYDERRVLVWPVVGMNYVVLGQAKLRRNPKRVALYLKNEIKKREDIINHAQEHDEIKKLESELEEL